MLPISTEKPLAYLLDGQGSGERADSATLEPIQSGAFRWIQVDQTNPTHCDWLRDHLDLPPETIDVLLQDVARSYTSNVNGYVTIAFKGLDANAAVEQLHFISAHLVFSQNEMISIVAGNLHGLVNLETEIQLGQAPKDILALLHMLFGNLSTNLNTVIHQIEADIEGNCVKRLTMSEIVSLKTRLLHIKRHTQSNYDFFKTLDIPWHEQEASLTVACLKSRVFHNRDELQYLLDSCQLLIEKYPFDFIKRCNKKNNIFSAVQSITVIAVLVILLLWYFSYR